MSAGAAIVTLSLTWARVHRSSKWWMPHFLTPPPFTNPDSLVTLGEAPIDEPAAVRRAVAFATFEAWRERAGSLAALKPSTDEPDADRARSRGASGRTTSHGLLTLLGVTPQAASSIPLTSARRSFS